MFMNIPSYGAGNPKSGNCSELRGRDDILDVLDLYRHPDEILVHAHAGPSTLVGVSLLGCSIRYSTHPKFSARMNSFVPSTSFRACSNPPLISNDTIPENAFICRTAIS